MHVRHAADRSKRRTSSLLAQQTTSLTVPGPFLLGLALVMQLLAACQGQLDLGSALGIEIKLERHKRHSLTLDRTDQLVDLPAVQKQPARTLWWMIESVRLQIF